MTMDDFPEKDTFQDYRGKEVTFTYHLLDAGNIYSLRAVEVTRRRHPRTFCVYDEASPFNALWKMRQRIPQELNKRYFAEEKGRPFSRLNFDHFRGNIAFDHETGEACLVVDGKTMDMRDLGELLATYEGRHVEVRISEEAFER
jgi:hypothetical protein